MYVGHESVREMMNAEVCQPKFSKRQTWEKLTGVEIRSERRNNTTFLRTIDRHTLVHQ